MRVAFRVDASLEIGAGHVMRCLTLARALRARGHDCVFISRQHEGNLLDLVAESGFPAAGLVSRDALPAAEGLPAHARWLGADWRVDAVQAREVLTASGSVPDWLVVDHYALDSRWESAMADCCRAIAVIDDLADRAHDCALLLDQNLGRAPEDYRGLVPPECRLLTGPRHALLRPEFARWRPYSLSRRASPRLSRILITMGGVDRHNVTGRVLEALAGILPVSTHVQVVMGRQSPWSEQVRTQALTLPFRVEVLVDVREMAFLMADADLVIGAAGSTAWERCCLGVPSLQVVLADNQVAAAAALVGAGAAISLGLAADAAFADRLRQSVRALLAEPGRLGSLGRGAAAVTDGQGAEAFATALEELRLAAATRVPMTE